MLKYAREVTHYLLYIYDLMKIQLHSMPREPDHSDDPWAEVSKLTYDVCMQPYETELLTKNSYLHIYGLQGAGFNAQQLPIVSQTCNCLPGYEFADDQELTAGCVPEIEFADKNKLLNGFYAPSIDGDMYVTFLEQYLSSDFDSEQLPSLNFSSKLSKLFSYSEHSDVVSTFINVAMIGESLSLPRVRGYDERGARATAKARKKAAARGLLNRRHGFPGMTPKAADKSEAAKRVNFQTSNGGNTDLLLLSETVGLQNYGAYLVYAQSISAACQLDWPKNRILIQVLDDSDDGILQRLIKDVVDSWREKNVNIIYWHRFIRARYEARNLKSAMSCDSVRDYEYVAKFDANFQPIPDFLMLTIPHFKGNPELGLVQARWSFVNQDENLLTRLQNVNLCFHFEVEQQLNGIFLNFFEFNGTTGVWRIKALEDSGGWLERTTVADKDIAVRAHLNGWKFIFLNDVRIQTLNGTDVIHKFRGFSLRIDVSFTVPTVATRVFHFVRSWSLSKSSCLLPLRGKVQSKTRAHVVDESNTEVMNLQMRDSSKTKQVVAITKSDETHALPEFNGTKWSLMYSDGCLQLQTNAKEKGCVLELTGNRMLKIFPGIKLDFESKHCRHRRVEQDFKTVVEFPANFPYGKAVALLDLKTEFLKVEEEWFVVPGITLAFILSDILRKGGIYSGLIIVGNSLTYALDKRLEKMFYMQWFDWSTPPMKELIRNSRTNFFQPGENDAAAFRPRPDIEVV